jgi:hypothetical protein
VHVVLIDLIPALLSWEGRDVSSEPDVASGAAHALGHLYDGYQVLGVADAGHPRSSLRRWLEDEQLAVYFDGLINSAPYGPRLTGRAIRRIVDSGRKGDRGILVTARGHLAAEALAQRIPVVETRHSEFEGVPDAIFTISDGRRSG